MKPREIALLGAPFVGAPVLIWCLGGDEPAVVLGVGLGIAWLYLGYKQWALEQAACTDSTMGPRGDSIVGFEARVVTAEPLQVEVHGSVWRARLVEGASVFPEERVRVVGRQFLTLLVARGR